PTLLTPPPSPPVYPLSLHDALPIWPRRTRGHDGQLGVGRGDLVNVARMAELQLDAGAARPARAEPGGAQHDEHGRSRLEAELVEDRKSTRLNSSHGSSSYAVFCLKQ